MFKQDDRTKSQAESYYNIIVGRCSVMDHGVEGNGLSYAGWAVRPRDLVYAKKWVESRGDIEEIRVVDNDWSPPGDNDHYHIYLLDETHPAHGRVKYIHEYRTHSGSCLRQIATLFWLERGNV